MTRLMGDSAPTTPEMAARIRAGESTRSTASAPWPKPQPTSEAPSGAAIRGTAWNAAWLPRRCRARIPYRGTHATALVDSHDDVLHLVERHGGTMVDGPNDVPTGRNMTVRHPAGATVEYVQFHEAARATLSCPGRRPAGEARSAGGSCGLGRAYGVTGVWADRAGSTEGPESVCVGGSGAVRTRFRARGVAAGHRPRARTGVAGCGQPATGLGGVTLVRLSFRRGRHPFTR